MGKKEQLGDGFEGEVFGFLEAVGKAPEELGARARSHLVFDSIRARIGIDGTVNEDDSELAIIRVMSTMSRLSIGFGVTLKEGEWYRLRLKPEAYKPIAWILSAADDFQGDVVRTNVIGIDLLGSTPGADADRRALDAFCATSPPVQSLLAVTPYGVQNGTQSSIYPRMVDVGQASFCAIHSDRDVDAPIVGYYDVGGPIFFHHKSFPYNFEEEGRIPSHGFVALSHWDFDHYSLAQTSLKKLQKLDWYAPFQKIGPNAVKFQEQLGAKLKLLTGPTFQLAPGLTLVRGTAPPDDRNGSGYVFVHERARTKILLAGDVPYDCVPLQTKQSLTALAITHHGGKSSDSPPTPIRQGATAGVSFGLPNYYHHPSDKFLNAHTSAGWTIRKTRSSTSVRNDIWIA